tara:strand:+ start:604 stop:870 length:267 start_codon:yes stop_codon:yes gene_type:complete
VRALMPSERYQDVKVGDLIVLTKDNYGAIRYFGEIQIVTWVPENWAGRTRIIHVRENDWIQVYSAKQGKMWHVRLGEFEVLKKSNQSS